MKLPHRNKATLFIVIMILSLFPPNNSFALSGGNKAPEFESFQPFGLDNMVDPATGDFSYNIPLMNVGFHGVNLFYQAGISMEQEASMVGLGWNINSGVINRTVRGIPDDFNGDLITKEQYVKPSKTWGLVAGGEIELTGSDLLDIKGAIDIYYNNISGLGFKYSFPAPTIASKSFGGKGLLSGIGLKTKIQIGNQSGVTVTPTLSFEQRIKDAENRDVKPGIDVGWSINSRVGLSGMTLQGMYEIDDKYKNKIPYGNSLSFAKPVFTPSINWPYSNISFNAKISGPVSGFLSHSGSSLAGYFTRQGQLTSQLEIQSFGLLYFNSMVDSNNKFLNDISRSNDLPITNELTNLAVPSLDFDLYSITGPGNIGNMRFKRGDNGLYYEGKTSNTSGGVNIGIEGGGPAVSHVGVNGGANISISESTSWMQDNLLLSSMRVMDKQINNPKIENAFLLKEGDFQVSKINSNDLFQQIGGYKPVRPKLFERSKHRYGIGNELRTTFTSIQDFPITSVLNENERLKRKNVITPYTFRELAALSDSFSLKNFNQFHHHNELVFYENLTLGKPNHIGKIEIKNEDGNNYIYGIPVYNKYQEETSFGAKGDNTNVECETGQLIFDTQILVDKKGETGTRTRYYSSNKMPPYVSSYLLTGIVSDDYVDRTNDGLTSDDFGNYVKYNYSKINVDYKWRTPHTKDQGVASYNKGLLTESEDDKGNFIYGEREQYYIHSIESKTEIAEFSYFDEARKDNRMAESKSGGISSESTFALKKIVKYSKNDLLKENPLKTIYFEYDYSLCGGTTNSVSDEEGKLTLKKLYLLNGNSNKGRFSPYEFEYGFNPSYEPKAQTRWGAYLPINIYDKINSAGNCLLSSSEDLITSEFPYTPQFDLNEPFDNPIEDFSSFRENYIDLYASAWNLSKIKLPSGGSFDISYESDDYGYVQNKEAMNMFPIIATSKGDIPKNSISFETHSKLFENHLINTTNYNFIYFNLGKNKITETIEDSVNDIERKILFRKYFLKDIVDEKVFLKIHGKVGKNNESLYEVLPTWGEIEDYGIVKNNPYVGFIKLKDTCLGDKESGCLPTRKINSIAKGLMQLVKLRLPSYLYEGDPSINDQGEDETGILENITSLASITTQLDIFLSGVNNYLREQNVGNQIMNRKSFIRLYNPITMKLSGTHRVKRILINNEWANMAGAPHKTSKIGKQYIYSISSNTDNILREISTGVTAYEPIIGGEENPLFQPITFKEKNFLAPDNKTTITTPLMESYYPAPQIVYGKIKINDIGSELIDVGNNPDLFEESGFTIFEHYTYKDFPIRTYETSIDAKLKSTPSVLKLLNIKNIASAHASQGYSILHPKMHGKLKSSFIYNSSGKKISGTKYFYKSSDGFLDNIVPALFSNNTISRQSRLGFDYEMFGDIRKVYDFTSSLGKNGNLELTPIPPITPVSPPIIVPYPSASMEEKVFRSIVLVKNITQHGIIDKVETYNGNSTISTKNLLWDAETAQPILTETRNEFEDPVFNLNLPAHLAYKNMGQAYQNTGATFSGVSISNGDIVAAPPNFVETLTEGDKLAFYNSQDSDPSIDLYQFGWVLKSGQNSIKIINESGQLFTTDNLKYVKIIESGYENKAVASIASYTMKVNPIQGDKLVIDESKKILQASTTVYSDRWQTFCRRDANNVNNQNSNEGNSSGQGQGVNLIFNGNFENGDVGFTSDYTQFDNIVNGGYNIVNNQDAKLYEELCQCDLGASHGNVFLANNNGYDGHYDLFCQDVNLQGGEEYKFSFEHLNYCPCVSRGLRLKINGSSLSCKARLNSCRICLWYNNEFSFIAPTSGQSQICLEHVNDIQTCQWPAIDNLELYNVSETTSPVPPNPGNEQVSCLPTTQDIVNPFLKNIKGNWRALKSFVFQTDRSSTDNIREDGHFINDANNYNNKFIDFWKLNYSSKKLEPNIGNWTWTSENTMVSPFGNEVEAKDPLNRYSAELVANTNQKVVAVAANAKYSEIAYYGAEIPISNNGNSIWPFSIPSRCGIPYHTNIEEGKRVHYTGLVLPNSGNYCLEYSPGLKTILKFDTTLDDPNCIENNSAPYVVQPCDCLPIFNPTVGKKYLLSVWLHHSCLQDDICENQPNLNVSIGNQNFIIDEYGPLIEGWRKVEGTFTIPNNATDGEVKLNIPSGVAYLDDIRIHPFNASMKTYNYDQNTLRFTFEHDDNNFYTRYDYANDGSLKRVSKQTERSLQTLQESVTSQYKQN